MLTRRLFTATALSSGVLALTGCGKPPPPLSFDLGQATVDTHMHLFNGRDVPARGFLQQVIFRDMKDSLPGGVLLPLADLITGFLLLGTRTAGAELSERPDAAAETDEVLLARAIDGYYGQASEQAQAMVARSGVATETAALQPPELMLLEEMSKAASVPVGEAAAGIPAPGGQAAIARSTAAPTPSIGQQLAPGLLNPDRASIDLKSLNLAGVLQWAVLMTRDRADIWRRAVSLYGKPGEARIFCNYLVDLAMWLNPYEPPPATSRMSDQIRLAQTLSRAHKDVLVLNFAPFCPLRAAIEGPGVLRQVQRAVMEQGFVGVKLYPAMGFRPGDNRSISLDHASSFARSRNPSRAAMDAALQALYRWCNDNDVPIATHASHSMGAGPRTEEYSAPWLWAPVLATHSALRVNLAHFGGFGAHSPRHWQEQLGEMIASGAPLFFDTGYWDEAARDRDAAILQRSLAFLDRYPKALRLMMYGSDWHMIAREPDHNAYHGRLRGFIAALAGGNEAKTRAMMSGNALRWLGLDRPDGAQFARLRRHYSGHPVWQELFGAV